MPPRKKERERRAEGPGTFRGPLRWVETACHAPQELLRKSGARWKAESLKSGGNGRRMHAPKLGEWEPHHTWLSSLNQVAPSCNVLCVAGCSESSARSSRPLAQLFTGSIFRVWGFWVFLGQTMMCPLEMGVQALWLGFFTRCQRSRKYRQTPRLVGISCWWAPRCRHVSRIRVQLD